MEGPERAAEAPGLGIQCFGSDQWAFEVLEPKVCRQLGHYPEWPKIEFLHQLNERLGPRGPGFCRYQSEMVKRSGGYEPFIARYRMVPTRERNWHDLFNALVWLHYPLLKAELNRLQVSEMNSPEVDQRNRRTKLQNQATLFDECGLIVVSDDASILENISLLRWKELFWTERVRLQRHARFLLFGHALFEALLEPYLGLTAKAILRPVPKSVLDYDIENLRNWLDAELTRELPQYLSSGERLYPVPILGIPKWYSDQDSAFYDNTDYFRSYRWRLRS